MASQPDPAAERYRHTASVARRVAAEIQRIWRGLTAPRIEGHLEGDAGLGMLELLVAGQLSVASGAQEYVADSVAAGAQFARAGAVAASAILRPQGFAGIASDGRPLASLLFVPALTVATRRAAGATDEEAMLAGLYQMTRIVATQVADTDRAATQVAMAANPNTRMYARVVHLPACARCIILSGRTYSYSEAFRRHPQCDCTIEAVTDEQWRRMPSPMDLFNELSPKQQRKAFTVAGAEAIRMGADMGQVVNARRGMDSPGAATTTEGASVRSVYARQVRRAGGAIDRGPGRYSVVLAPRLTPEAIFDRTDDRAEQRVLLRQYAYLV